jgi:acetyl-CoA synthetase
MTPTDAFMRAREHLLRHRDDYEAAYSGFRWPELDKFNWAIDWFDVHAQGNARTALHLIDGQGREAQISFAQMSEASDRVAACLQRLGMERGDRMLVMLPNVQALWELVLGAMKIGVVLVPTATQASVADLQDRTGRGKVRLAVTDAAGAEKLEQVAGTFLRLLVGGARTGWHAYAETVAEAPARPQMRGETRATDPLLLYFTSGTTALPKLVQHTHASYPVGHLSTMYWIGIKEGDVHQNISSPGWAKHAWSSIFAPWNAGATILVHDYARSQASQTLGLLDRCGVDTLCAPPTVWRMLILESLGQKPRRLRELASAGEPLNPEVIDQVERAWGLTIRDGYGQTETTAQVGNSPGQRVKTGAMGRPLPGYRVALLDGDGKPADEGELSLQLDRRPLGLMVGYADDPQRTAAAMADGFYRTGDEARRDEEGYLHFVGRGDDIFKSSDYRISPFELESVLVEHDLVAEAAVIPSPDPLRLCVPKAYVTLRPGVEPSVAAAAEILADTNAKLAGFKKIRRLEFAELPKTISGKIRRAELRRVDRERHAAGQRGEREHWLEDLPKS